MQTLTRTAVIALLINCYLSFAAYYEMEMRGYLREDITTNDLGFYTPELTNNPNDLLVENWYQMVS